ncbi:MAG TPA: PKD domain-containing protein, partial [Pyrinomonadaceae bacterium]|nr:PKD domain-containing protein [Pyrinomonadaceae bacterium]
FMTTAASAQATAPLKFEIKIVDSVTGQRKSKYVLGEKVTVVITLTNQGRRARTISQLEDTSIPYTLVWVFEDEEPKTETGWWGGTTGTYVSGNTVFWTVSKPRKVTLAPGQSSSMRIDDLRTSGSGRLRDGSYKLSVKYGNRLKATVSFQIVIDAAKSIPLLEKLAAAPSRNGDESDKRWANFYLNEIRQPSLTGLVTDTAGKPLKEVSISVTGSLEGSLETRSNGRYYLSQLKRGGTYTLTPSLNRDGYFDADYTFEPASRTITDLNSKLTNLNFTATLVRPATNIADRIFEGARARASSTRSALDDKFEPDNVIDGKKLGAWDHCCNAAWSDDTPYQFPDWVELTLKSRTTIDWINVFTVQDKPDDSSEPSLNETFTKDGITDFDVQYWTGRVWKNVPGGSIRGNRNVWRKVTFPRITTDKIRVVVRNAMGPYSNIMEIEAFHINQKPEVKLTGTSIGKAETSFQFHTSAADRDRGISSYTFSFGDGTPDYKLEYGEDPGIKQLNLTHTHTYEKAGTYTVTVRVMDHDDEGNEIEMPVVVTERPKPPFAVGDVFHGVVGEAVVFEARESSDRDASKVQYYWYFDDEVRPGAGPTVSRQYRAPGTYSVILLIVDEDGWRTRYLAPVVIAGTAK